MHTSCAPTQIPSAGNVSNEVASHRVQPASLQPVNLLSCPCLTDRYRVASSHSWSDGHSHQYDAVECVLSKRCAPTHIATGSYVSIDVATENILLSTSCFWLVHQYTVFRCGGDGSIHRSIRIRLLSLLERRTFSPVRCRGVRID